MVRLLFQFETDLPAILVTHIELLHYIIALQEARTRLNLSLRDLTAELEKQSRKLLSIPGKGKGQLSKPLRWKGGINTNYLGILKSETIRAQWPGRGVYNQTLGV